MALRPQGSEPGLRAFSDSRETRRRAVVLGKIRVREVATKFWLFTFASFLVFGLGYWQYAEAELAASKSEVLGRQRALGAALGKGARQLQSRGEAWLEWLAHADQLAAQPQILEPTAALGEVPLGPGVYVRMGLSNARMGPEAIRVAAEESGHDGFTSCFYAGNRLTPPGAKVCRSAEECGPGQYCGARGRCVVPTEPLDMRWLYSALAVLRPQWVQSLAEATNDYKVRALDMQLGAVSKHEAPIAIQMAERSRFFTAVVDVDTMDDAEGEPVQAQNLRDLRTRPHPVRVGMWQLQDGKLLAAVQLEAAGRLVGGGELALAPGTPERVQAAAKRQANDCALALDFRRALEHALTSASVGGVQTP